MPSSIATQSDPYSPSDSSESSADAQSWLTRLKAALRRRRSPSIRAGLSDVLQDPALTQDVFSPEERAMLRNILGLRERRLDDIMVPRADIVSVAEDISLADLLTVFREAGHSRLPIYRETLDDPVGMVHIKDLVSFLLSGAALRAENAAPSRKRRTAALQHLAKVDFTRPLASVRISRPVLFVPPSMPAIDLLVKMQTTRIHMALVIDEYGGTDGLVTIEDLVEQVVGEIEDEHDFDEAPLITRRATGGFVADARAPLEDVSTAVAVDLEVGEEAEEVDTLGGLIVTLAGRVPVRGELIAGPQDLEFEILDADPRRIKRVGILRRARRAWAEPKRGRTKVAEQMSSLPAPEADPAESVTDLERRPVDQDQKATPNAEHATSDAGFEGETLAKDGVGR
jgi:CBS domain containing-hemolysin-like protein